MPMIFVPNSCKEGQSTSKGPDKLFVGDVYLNLVHSDDQNVIADVTFTPCARTNWHTHEGGQLIRCVAGSGWICDRGDSPQRLKVGDTVWCPPGTEHWHGADDGSYMTHFVHAHGKTEWKEAVSEDDYAKKSTRTASQATDIFGS